MSHFKSLPHPETFGVSDASILNSFGCRKSRMALGLTHLILIVLIRRPKISLYIVIGTIMHLTIVK